MTETAPATTTLPLGEAVRPSRRWLLFVHQLPASPSNLRVRTWRRLQQLGAVPVKQAVYVLPDTPAGREDFEWLKTEVKDSGGDASVFAADSVDAWADDALVEDFRRARQEAYGILAADIDRVLHRLTQTRRPRGTRAPAVRRLVNGFRERLTAIEHIDFFGSAGRDRVVTILAQLEARSRQPPRAASGPSIGGSDAGTHANRLWVTRPRPGVDRMGSAWLIRRFVDPAARFGFAADREALPTPDAIPFDMFGVELSHRGEGCTFETLLTVFGMQDPAVDRIAAIVHDLDLKDGRFGAPEAPTIGTLIEGLQLATADDHDLLERGISLFESLYTAFAHTSRTARPRPVAKSRVRTPATTRRRTPATRRRRD